MSRPTLRPLPVQWPDGERSLLMDGTTYGHVYEAAATIRSQIDVSGGRGLCVASEDRFEVAAALVAAALDDLRLVLPYSLTPAVVEAACREQRCASILGEAGTALAGIHPVRLGDRTDQSGVRPSDLVGDLGTLCLHTGGTTGQPRAWRRPLSSLYLEADVLASHLGLCGQDRILATVSPLHIYGFMMSVLLPLRVGAQVARWSAYYPREVESSLRDQGCTVLVTTPPHLRILSRGLRVSDAFRLAVSSGSMLGHPDALRFHSETASPIVEVYGSTETGVVATRCRARGEAAWIPARGVDWRIEQDRLWVRSPFLSESLAVDSEGYTRTGDRATVAAADVTADGFILHGRVDGVVKVASVRVDVGGVEERIRGLAGVRDACVITHAVDGLRENVLLAAVVYDGPVETLKRTLQQVLPPVECPRRVVLVNRLPTSPPGKHDRQAVQALLRSVAEDEAEPHEE
jgi:acyl-coenzyme A synthetase/AMP-(fatty) acid ligase